MQTSSAELALLNEKIDAETRSMEGWRRPSQVLLFETLRAIDNAYCEELFVPNEEHEQNALLHRSLLKWGVNKALARILPDELAHGAFKLFPSKENTQEKADWFLFQSGVLQRAELLRDWLAEGLVSARLDKPPMSSPLIKDILVLKTSHPSLFQGIVAHTQRQWMSERIRARDRAWEADLERQHMEMLPQLDKQVERFQGWGITYDTTDEIDRYFLEWGKVYLRRMWSQDLIGLEEKIGGHQFNEYLGVLAALSGRANKHLCYTWLLKGRHPELDIRNLLTTFSGYDEFLVSVTRFLDGDIIQVQKLLASLTLEPLNKATHVMSARTAWAPIVRATHEHVILPLYGLEINPFLFLLADLQAKYPKDWSEAANRREQRWLAELRSIFGADRWQTSERPIALRDGERVLTDVDFLVYDMASNQVALFQLKWQQPVGVDTRARRSAAKNLVTESNRWIASVRTWLEQNGVKELSRRAGISIKQDARVELFILGRYDALFPGVAVRDERAVWSDWNHFLKTFGEDPSRSLRRLGRRIKEEATRIQSSNSPESFAVPVGDLTILLNPTKEPRRA